MKHSFLLWFLLCGIACLTSGAVGHIRANTLPPLSPSAPAQETKRVLLPLIVTSGEPEQPPPENDMYTGEGTFYGATGAGNCGFDATPDNLMVAAMNHTDYADALLCGAYVEVTGPEGTVTVRIVDRCPECAPGDIDLSEQAFALIADPIDGRVPIRWHIVSPELDGPIVYRFKEGSNPYWTAVQIRNHRNPVVSFAYQGADGQFISVNREPYNYFVAPAGMGERPYTFRVTDIYGHTLTDNSIMLMPEAEITGSAQFPAP